MDRGIHWAAGAHQLQRMRHPKAGLMVISTAVGDVDGKPGAAQLGRPRGNCEPVQRGIDCAYCSCDLIVETPIRAAAYRQIRSGRERDVARAREQRHGECAAVLVGNGYGVPMRGIEDERAI